MLSRRIRYNMTYNTKPWHYQNINLMDDQKTKINAEIIQDTPPPTGLKKEVLKFLSVNNIVIPPAKTGKDNNNKNAVIKIDQTNKGQLS